MLIVVLRGIKIAKPDEAIIVTLRKKPGAEPSDSNAGQRVVFGSRVFVKPPRKPRAAKPGS